MLSLCKIVLEAITMSDYLSLICFWASSLRRIKSVVNKKQDKAKMKLKAFFVTLISLAVVSLFANKLSVAYAQ